MSNDNWQLVYPVVGGAKKKPCPAELWGKCLNFLYIEVKMAGSWAFSLTLSAYIDYGVG